MLCYPAPALDFLKNPKKRGKRKGLILVTIHLLHPRPQQKGILFEDSEADLFPLTHQVMVSLTCFLSLLLLFTWFWGPHHPHLSSVWGGEGRFLQGRSPSQEPPRPTSLLSQEPGMCVGAADRNATLRVSGPDSSLLPPRLLLTGLGNRSLSGDKGATLGSQRPGVRSMSKAGPQHSTLQDRLLNAGTEADLNISPSDQGDFQINMMTSGGNF